MNDVMRAFVLGFSAFLLANGATCHTRPESGRPVSLRAEEILLASKRDRQAERMPPEAENALEVQVITYARSGDIVRAATTNREGFVRFAGLGPGDYTLHIPTGLLEPLYQSVRITRGNAGPARTIAAISNMTCGRVCAVDGIGGPLPSPPACLFQAQP